MANLNLNFDSANSNTEVVQLLELGNGVVQITMKDEKHRNSFSEELSEGVSKCFDAVAQNKSYKVVILTGYGNYFASGATKEDLIEVHKGKIKIDDAHFSRFVLDSCEIPIIAAMQGHGIGGGFLLGLDADFVVLSEESIYTINCMEYGFTPIKGATLILSKKLGILGEEMVYTAQNYRGAELAKRGIPFPVVPRKYVLKYALNLANKIAEKPRLSLVTLKEHLTSEIREKLPEFLKKEIEMHAITFHQPEVASRIETSFGEARVISSKSHNLNQTWVKETENIHNNLPNKSKIKNRNNGNRNNGKINLFEDKNYEPRISRKAKEQDYILSDLKAGNISVDEAESLLVRIHQNKINSEDNRKNLFADSSPNLNTRVRLFCFHGGGGSTLWFKDWSKNWQSNIEVYPVELPGRGTRSKEKLLTDFLALMKNLGEIISQKIDSPFAFFGHSMGGLICFELAHLLKQEYDLSPIHLFISAGWSPHMFNKNLKERNILDLNSIGKFLDIPQSILKEGSLLQKNMPVFEADLKLLQSYSQTKKPLLNCPISVFGGIEDPVTSKKDILEWSHYTSSTFKLQMLPGKHLFIRDSQNQKILLDDIAKDLKISLDRMS